MSPSPRASRVSPTWENTFPKLRYRKRFRPVKNSLLLPRIQQPGKYWEGQPRIPDLPTNPSPRPSTFQHQRTIQYRGSLAATAIASVGAVHDTAKNQTPNFLIRRPHPLSECLTYEYHTMENGQKMTIKDTAPKFTSPEQSADQKPKSQLNGAGDVANAVIDDGSDFSTTAFDRTNKKIGVIVQRILPNIPHLLSVPTKNPYQTRFPYENRNTPFEEWEVKELQHMTLISSGSRGVAWVRGDWEDEYNANSPNSGPRSGTVTPQSERDPNKPRVKMSFADYKAGKRPPSSSQPSRPSAVHSEQKLPSSVAVPAVSPTQQMIDQIIAESQPHPETSRPKPEIPRSPPRKDVWIAPIPDIPMPKPEGQAERGRAVWPLSNVPDWKQSSKQPPQQISQLPMSKSQPLPSSQTKRPNDANDQSRPEKRAKVDHQQTSKVPEPAPEKPSPLKSVQKLPNVSGKAANKPLTSALPPKPSTVAAETKQKAPHANTSSTPTTTSAVNSQDAMPPLLSPLPPSLNSPSHRADAQSSGPVKASQPNHETPPSSSKSKPIEKKSYAIPPPVKTDSPSEEDPDALPPLLSPLPDWFMERIAREREEMMREIEESSRMEDRASNSSANTVGARRERSRQPDAPGVARKTTKTKPSAMKELEEPSKATSSKSVPKADDSVGQRKERFLVKIKYGKRNAKNISRILGMSQKAQAIVAPISSTNEVRKHVRPMNEDDEPSSKRAKVAAPTDLQKPHTPLTPASQSPAPSAPPTIQKSFGTPKKGDAMKSVAMRKVDSSEGRVQTPHGAVTSAPTSAEKPRVNGSDIKWTEVEALKATHTKYVAIGTTLKREADRILKTKERNPGPVSEEDKKLGAVVAIESVIAYMIAFHSIDSSHRIAERKPGNGENWTQFFAFLQFATERAKPYEELYTVALLLGGVCREALERVYTERFTAEPTASLVEMAKNARSRLSILAHYREQAKLHPVEFVLTVNEAKGVAVNVLAAFCTKNNVAWEMRLAL